LESSKIRHLQDKRDALKKLLAKERKNENNFTAENKKLHNEIRGQDVRFKKKFS